jgi:hypothetical protein
VTGFYHIKVVFQRNHNILLCQNNNNTGTSPCQARPFYRYNETGDQRLVPSWGDCSKKKKNDKKLLTIIEHMCYSLDTQ